MCLKPGPLGWIWVLFLGILLYSPLFWNLKNNMNSERGQSAKTTYCVTPFGQNGKKLQKCRDKNTACWFGVGSELIANKHSLFSFRESDECSKVGYSDGYKCIGIGIYILSGWISWYLNYISIKGLTIMVGTRILQRTEGLLHGLVVLDVELST